MPPRAPPKVYQLLLKTHKLTIFLTVAPSTTVASLKEEALSALVSDVNQEVDGIPSITTEADFEISRSTKGKGRNPNPNPPPVPGNPVATAPEYEVLDVSKEVRECGLSNWDNLFIQFRDPSGNLLPVTYTQASFEDDDEQKSGVAPSVDGTSSPGPSVNKGKRKAHPE